MRMGVFFLMTALLKFGDLGLGYLAACVKRQLLSLYLALQVLSCLVDELDLARAGCHACSTVTTLRCCSKPQVNPAVETGYKHCLHPVK